MNHLFILNGAPYGSERTYNGLRLANSLAGKEGDSISIFLGAKRSSLDELAACTLEADRVLVF